MSWLRDLQSPSWLASVRRGAHRPRLRLVPPPAEAAPSSSADICSGAPAGPTMDLQQFLDWRRAVLAERAANGGISRSRGSARLRLRLGS